MQKNLFDKIMGSKKVLAIAFIASLALPFLASLNGHLWERNLDFIAIYIMLAIGLNIMLGYAGLLTIGFIAFYGCGAYCYALLASPQLNIHWHPLLVIPLSGLVAAFVGLIVGAPAIRLKDDYLALVTLAFGQIFLILVSNLNHPINITNGPQGIIGIDPIRLFGLDLSRDITVLGIHISSLQLYYYFFLIFVILFIFLSRYLEKSFIGRALMAVRDDEKAAESCGIVPYNYKILAFCLGAFCSGVAGALFAAFQEFVSPSSFYIVESFNIITIVLIGGMGDIVGIIVASFLMLSIPEILHSTLPALSEQISSHISIHGSLITQLLDPEIVHQFLLGIIIILMATFRPHGIFSNRKK